MVGNGERIRFWEDLWWSDQPLCSQFPSLYKVIFVKNLTILIVLGKSYPLFWNFNFYCNLTDTEIELLQRLMSSLSSVHLSPSVVDSKAWSLSSLGLFTVKYFFLALVQFLKSCLVHFGQVFCGNQKPLQRLRPLLG